MLLCPTIDDTDPVRQPSPSRGGHFSGNAIGKAMRQIRHRCPDTELRYAALTTGSEGPT